MLKEGSVLGERYLIGARIGSGGMADVYKAQDQKLNRLVAVKVMKAEFREDTNFVAKFQKEAQAAARLSHPNVVNVFDVGEDRGLYYIVMELVEGITLKNYITKKGKLSVKEATSIAIQVSLGLEAAHNRGIVHRDVKPQNIIISTDGKVKLSDFGIAKAINSNTITANVMGSVHYSSPEQVRGGQSDAKGDIYSLGVTTYEMVTGRVPFDGDSTVSIAIKHLQEEMIPPSRYTPDLPYSLEQIILKCTQKNPERRYQSVAELIEDMKRSLIDPQGNFVVIDPLSSHARTMAMSDRDVDDIRQKGGNVAPRPTRSSRDDRYREDRYRDEVRRSRRDDYDDEYDDDDDDERSTGLEKAVTIAGFLIAAVIIIILIVVIGNMAGLFHFGKSASSSSSSASTSVSAEIEDTKTTQVEVPSLLGMTLADATTTCNERGIGVKQIGTATSEEYDEGQIISQSISAGTNVELQTTIEVTISSGKADVTVPTGLAGMAQEDAEDTLQGLGLVPSIELQFSDDIAVGNVIAASPAEGSSVQPGSTVTLYISKGKDTSADVNVPDLIGVAEAAAKSTLDTLGLSYSTTTGWDSSKAEGVVTAMSPTVGTGVQKGSTVVLTINTKPEEEKPSRYVCLSPLSRPEGYNGGTVKLELVQGDQATTLYEGEDPWTTGTYSEPIYSTLGDTGIINVYEDGTLIARYPNVEFEAAE